MNKDTSPCNEERRKRSMVAIVSVAIAFMFVLSIPFLIGGNDNNDNFNGIILGADASVVISSDDSIDDIKTAIQTELNDSGVTTVTVTGSKTGGDGEIVLIIPDGKTVIWNADIDSECAVCIGGEGSFTASECSLSLIAIYSNGIGDTDIMIDCDVIILPSSGDWKSGIISPSTATLTFNKGLVSTETGRLFAGSGNVFVNGDVTFPGNVSYIETAGDGNVEITGNVTLGGNSSHIDTRGFSTATVNGDVLFTGDNSPRIKAYDHSIIDISGSLTFEGPEAFLCADGGTVDIGDIVTFEREGSSIASFGAMFLRGGVTFDGDGYMEAGNGGEITIDGDVTALSLPDNSIEAQLMVLGDAGEITVNGDVTTSGILAWLNYGTVIINGNAASTSEKAGVMFNTGGGSVTIEGTFTANAENYVLFWDYLEVDNLPVAKSDGVLNGEYYEWDGKDIVGGADPTVLRVNASYFDDGTGDGGEDGTGDGGEDGTGDGDGNDGISRTILIIIVIIILAVIIGLLFFFLFWKKREEEEEEGKEQQ